MKTDKWYWLRSGLRHLGWNILFLLFLANWAVAAPPAALLIANQSYVQAPLLTPSFDVRAIGQALRANGFSVTVIEDGSQIDHYASIDRFFTENAMASVHLFFYAGHAVQVNGRNYLVPVSAKLNKQDILSQLVDIRHLLEKLENTTSTVRLVILDACRTNPFSSHPNASNGLSELMAPPNTLVAFSTSPGKTAEDGEGPNSPYTTALLRYLFQPKVKIEDAFKNVRREVRQVTNNSQTPWESTSLERDFFLAQTVLPADVSKKKKSGAELVANLTGNPAKGECARLLAKLSLGLSPLSPIELTKLASCK